MNRIFLTKLHLITAAFMFPAIVMFLVTGGLYTWGNTGEWHEETTSIALEQPVVPTEEALKAIALGELDKRGVAAPSGKTRLRGEGQDAELQWTGARTEASVSLSDQPNVAEVTIKQASLHRWLVQLHKAKGSTIFKVYASVLAVVLFILVVSGLILGLQVKVYRGLTIWSSVAGILGFVGFVLLG